MPRAGCAGPRSAAPRGRGGREADGAARGRTRDAAAPRRRSSTTSAIRPSRGTASCVAFAGLENRTARGGSTSSAPTAATSWRSLAATAHLDLSPLGARNADRFARYDDLDPCWLPDGGSASRARDSRSSRRSARCRSRTCSPIGPKARGLTRITSERNGGEEPTVDLETGRIVFARWWVNPYLASERDPLGITTSRERAVTADPVNLWQAITVTPDGDGGRLAGGNPRVRAETMVYQPLVLEDGSLIGVRAETPRALSRGRGARVRDVSRRLRRAAPARRRRGTRIGVLAGVAARRPDPLLLRPRGPRRLRSLRGSPRRPRPRSACSTFRARSSWTPCRSWRATAAGAARRASPTRRTRCRSPTSGELRDSIDTFRFDCLNVFANAPVDLPFRTPRRSGATSASASTRSSPGRGAVRRHRRPRARGRRSIRSGAVHEHELPADTPMFEQLVDAHGRVLRSALGRPTSRASTRGRFGQRHQVRRLPHRPLRASRSRSAPGRGGGSTPPPRPR